MDNLDAFRREKDQFFKNHPQSPLTREQRALFNGLVYYPYAPELDLVLEAEEFADKANVKLLTTTGETRYYVRWGKVVFSAFGAEAQKAELVLFATPGSDEFFVPFMDATTGPETYSSGRYLEAPLLDGNRVHLDFNMAYSPYCAYNEPSALAESAGREPKAWSCPIPPKENRLTVPIRAGEKSPTGAWVEHG